MFVAVVGVVVGVVAAAVVKPKKPLKMRIPNQANRRKTLKKIRHPLWQTPEPLNPSLGPSGLPQSVPQGLLQVFRLDGLAQAARIINYTIQLEREAFKAKTDRHSRPACVSLFAPPSLTMFASCLQRRCLRFSEENMCWGIAFGTLYARSQPV